ncbi:FemAB family XrtA/PEP-CTERM system-associated protein [Limobrevibacterium gyesilva]|uniref:FemAB family PEP-CTERM system-associated protein n=1 Tax=Limobrevibacterium gyesilva TaxID=2991712 RepID=A0AA41YUV9_9PROT|nr:FemAB family XrtA/PEP-CTERM system-associated protein [Limobrevibacterium gyesilva]MCW3476920.1 FemAB family PEP-CTERM system-associated protein [Limobrevibacterium gyesilva]
MALACKPLDTAGEPAWDAFVRARLDGTFFHLAAWRHVIARAFGHATHYVLAERDGAVVGVLPLAQVKTRLFGNSLISVPFCVYGGPLAADAEAAAALQAHAAALMRRLDVPVLEFRCRDPQTLTAAGLDPAEWQARSDLYVTFRKPFTGDDAANLKAIPRKQRAMVRKGIDRGLASVIDGSAGRLHRIYAESVRNLGTPVFARRYFDILLEAFGDATDIVTVLDGETAIASVISFYFRDEVLPYYGGGRAIARERHGNDFMYWEVMRRAAARGYRLFDFGRSKLGTGSFAFKKNWGFTPEPLQYCFRLAPGASIPDTNPLNPKYRLFIAAWKRLPLPLANAIGPHIVRGVG